VTTLPDSMLWIFAALVGAAIGSFLNVCIYRLPEGESVVSPRSRCPECSTPIGWRDNIPVLGWVMLRGRCRSCRTSISVQYPLIELATAAVWAAAAVRYGLAWEALSVAVFFTLLLGIALTDARTYIIPDEFSVGGTILGLLLALAPGGISFTSALLGAALGFGLLWLVAWGGEIVFQKPAMGGGDIKMMAMVGAFLGPTGVLLTIFLGALVGTIVFAPISWRTGKLVPFGIFLALGAGVAEVWGPWLVGWYATTILGI
jgi:leader peptidase (prepilin peptidase) / N-methyltransferase